MTQIGYVLLICLLSTFTFGQGTWSVAGGVTPAFVRTQYPRTTLYPDSDGQLVEPVELAGRTSAFSYVTGLTLYYTYAPGWSIATGIGYRAQTTHQPRRSATSEGTTTLRERAMRIPLLFTYRPVTRRLAPCYSFGLLVDLPGTARIIERRSGQPTQHLRLDTSPGPVFSVLVGAGGAYQIIPRWALLAQPIVTYKLGRFGNAQVHSPAVELGLMTQIVRSF